MNNNYKYMVTLKPNVSIAPDRFVRIVETRGPSPLDALASAIILFENEDTHIWQSNVIDIKIERVA